LSVRVGGQGVRRAVYPHRAPRRARRVGRRRPARVV